MKSHLKIVIVILGAFMLAAAFPLMIWKLTSHTSTDHLSGAGPGHYLTRKQVTLTGCATPEAALQSMVWAAVNGDSDKAFACLGPDVQADIGKRRNGRRQFDARIKNYAQIIQGMQITARKVLADDQVELKFKLDTSAPPQNGGPIPDFLVQLLVKLGDEWKVCGDTKPYTPDWDEGSQPEPGAS
ncbi:MAG: hypothetical protein ABSB84_09735 [Verrucomicrobiota bacterium]